MRSCVGDKTAFLANQAEHQTGVQTDGAGLRHHQVAVGQGKALAWFVRDLGALAGVNTAVPARLLTGPLGRGQEFAVVHAAGRVQAHGVVPLAVALGAQAQTDGGQGALQTGIAADQQSLVNRERRGKCGQGDALPQGFGGQLAVKVARGGNAAQQGLGLLGLRLGWHLCQFDTGFPIDPGGVLLLFGAHGRDRVIGHAPLPRAQGRPGFPRQVVVVHAIAGALVKGFQGRVLQALRLAFANCAPHPTAFFARELDAPTVVLQGAHRGFGVVGGQADQGQGDQLFGTGAKGRDFVVQVATGLFGDGMHGLGPRRVDHGHGLFGRTGLVDLHGQTRTVPDHDFAQGLFGQHEPRGLGATLVDLALGVPPASNVGGGPRRRHHAALPVAQGATAQEAALIAHAVERPLRVKQAPLFAAGQEGQPIGTQAVFPITALKRGQALGDLCDRRRV